MQVAFLAHVVVRGGTPGPVPDPEEDPQKLQRRGCSSGCGTGPSGHCSFVPGLINQLPELIDRLPEPGDELTPDPAFLNCESNQLIDHGRILQSLIANSIN